MIVHSSFTRARTVAAVILRLWDILGRKRLLRIAARLLRIARRARRLRLIAGLLQRIAARWLIRDLLSLGRRRLELGGRALRIGCNLSLGGRLRRDWAQRAGRHCGERHKSDAGKILHLRLQ
jgi:hypothetical protein